MSHDHEAIVARISGSSRTDIHDVDSLQELLYGPYNADQRSTSAREEDLQLPAFDAAPPEITEAVLNA